MRTIGIITALIGLTFFSTAFAHTTNDIPEGWEVKGNGLILERVKPVVVLQTQPKSSGNGHAKEHAHMPLSEKDSFQMESRDVNDAVGEILSETHLEPAVFNLENVTVSYERSPIKQPAVVR